jgi:hypothetical protein
MIAKRKGHVIWEENTKNGRILRKMGEYYGK